MSKKLLLLLLLISQGVLVGLAQRRDTPKVDVQTFVTQMYIHGLPYEEAKAYGKKAVPDLLKMLNDVTLEQHWPNIIITLGYIGDPSAVTSLKNFIENSKGEISISRFRAILRVFQALGHISQTKDKESFRILEEYTATNSWQAKNLQFRYNQYTKETLSEVLARQAIVGLGISGTPEALKKLQEIKQKKETRKDWEDNLAEAINLNNQVKNQGARAVFGEKL